MFSGDGSLAINSAVRLRSTGLAIINMLGSDPFDDASSPVIVYARRAFRRLAKRGHCTIVSVRLGSAATSTTVTRVRALLDSALGGRIIFSGQVRKGQVVRDAC